MAKLPWPPDALPPLRRGDLYQLRARDELWRVYFASGSHPTKWDEFRPFGPVDVRFDHHLPPKREQERGILYAAMRGPVCIAEVFQATRAINRARDEPWLVCFALRRDVILLDLTASWPTRAGASQAISSGRRDVARAWSRKIYEQYEEVEGLWYRSSMYGRGVALALYERARSALPRRPQFHQPLVDPRLLAILQRVAADINYRLL